MRVCNRERGLCIMVTCLYTPRPPLYPEVLRGYDLLSSCVHVSSLVFQYRVLPGLLLPSQSCLMELFLELEVQPALPRRSSGYSILGSLVFPFLIELLHPEIQWYQLCFHFLCLYAICFESCYFDANSFTSPRRLRFFKG